MYNITQEQIQKIIDYLWEHPFKEVVWHIQILSSLPKIKDKNDSK